MRPLSQMDCHRRLRGKGKSSPGDDHGTFDIPLRCNVHATEPRKVVAVVSTSCGWVKLSLVVKTYVNRRWQERCPYPSEVQRLLPLFFHPYEIPIQYHTQPGKLDKGSDFYLPPDTRHLPPLSFSHT